MQSSSSHAPICTLLGDDAARICTLTAALLSHLPSAPRPDFHPHYQAILNTFTTLEKLLHALHELSAHGNGGRQHDEGNSPRCLEESIHNLCIAAREHSHGAIKGAANIEHMITKRLASPTLFLYIQCALASWDQNWIPPRLATAGTVRVLARQLKAALRSLEVHLVTVDTAIASVSGHPTPFPYNSILPTTSDLLWFDRHLEFMKTLSHSNTLLPYDPSEGISIEKWSGIHAHYDGQHSLPSITTSIRVIQPLRRAFEGLDKADPKTAHSELSKHVSSVIGVAGPVLQSLASTFCLPTEPWSHPDCDIYPILTTIFDSTSHTKLSDVVPGSQNLLVRDVLVDFDLKARENVRALRYWINHIRLVGRAIDPCSHTRVVPLKTTFSILDIVVQLIGACTSYWFQSHSFNIFHWVQHWTYAASVGVSLTAALDPTGIARPKETLARALLIVLTLLFGFLCTYSIIPAFVNEGNSDIFRESISIMCMDIFLHVLHAVDRALRPPPPDVRHEKVIPAIRNVISELNELVNWWEELREAISSVSKPHLPFRLSPAQCQTVFDNFTSRYVGAAENRTRPHFGGLQALVSTSTVMWDNSFVRCPSLHPFVWSKKTRAWQYTTCALCDVTSSKQLKRQEILGRREGTFEGETQPAKRRRI